MLVQSKLLFCSYCWKENIYAKELHCLDASRRFIYKLRYCDCQCLFRKCIITLKVKHSELENATKCHCGNVLGNNFNNIVIYSVPKNLYSHAKDRTATNLRQATMERFLWHSAFHAQLQAPCKSYNPALKKRFHFLMNISLYYSTIHASYLTNSKYFFLKHFRKWKTHLSPNCWGGGDRNGNIFHLI